MAGTTISNAALDVLRDEPAKAIALYVYLCRHVDYKTGVVGAVRRISYQSMREWLSVPATAGRAAESCSKATVQSLLRRLEGVGLISDMGNCVFLLKYELAHHSVSRRLILGKYEDDSNIAINNNDLTDRLIRGDSEVATPLINQSINQSVDKFVMSNEWIPDDCFPDLAAMAGFDVSKEGPQRSLMNLALLDVRLYWQAKHPGECRNQAGWHQALLGTMNKLASDAAKPKSSAKPPGGWSGRRPGAGDGLPRDDADLIGWARKNGARGPKPGESYFDYRRELRTHADKLKSNKGVV